MNYNTLSLGKYLDVLPVLDRHLSDIDEQAEILAVLNDTTTDEVLNQPLLEYAHMALESAFLREPLAPDPKRVAKRYKIGSFDLVPVTDPMKMTAAQYIDFQTFAGQQKNYEKMPELLSCLLVPRGHDYTEGYDVMEVQKAIREGLTAADAFNLSAFFLNRCGRLIGRIVTYCRRLTRNLEDGPMKEKLTQQIAAARSFLEGGDGLAVWMR